MSGIEKIIDRIRSATKMDLAFGKVDETPPVGPLSGAYMVFTRSDDNEAFAYKVKECFGIERDDDIMPINDTGTMTEEKFIDWFFNCVWKLFDGETYNMYKLVTDKDE
jgi:hypothetical protein